MSELQFTAHAERRMRQRGVRREDVMQIVNNAEEPKLLGGGLLSYYLPRNLPPNMSDRVRRLVVVMDPANTMIITIIKISDHKRSSYVGNFRRCS